MDLNEFNFNEQWVPVYKFQDFNEERPIQHFFTALGVINNNKLHFVSLDKGMNEFIYDVRTHGVVAFAMVFDDDKLIIVDEAGVRLLNLTSGEEIVNVAFEKTCMIECMFDCITVAGYIDDKKTGVSLHCKSWVEESVDLCTFKNNIKFSKSVLEKNADGDLLTKNNVKNVNCDIKYNVLNGDVFVDNKKINVFGYIEDCSAVFVYDDHAVFAYKNEQISTNETNVHKLIASICRRNCTKLVANNLHLMATPDGVRIGVLNGKTLVEGGVPVNSNVTLLNEHMPTCSASMYMLTDVATVDLTQNKYELNLTNLYTNKTYFTIALANNDNDNLQALIVNVDPTLTFDEQNLIQCTCSLVNVCHDVQTKVAEHTVFFVDRETIQGKIVDYGGVLLYKNNVQWALDDKGGWTNTVFVNGRNVSLVDYIPDFDANNDKHFVTAVDDARRGTSWTFILLNNDGKTIYGSMPLDTTDVMLFGNNLLALRCTTAGDLFVYNLLDFKEVLVDVQDVHTTWMVNMINGVLLRTDNRLLFITENGNANTVAVENVKMLDAKPFVTPDGELFSIIDSMITPLVLSDNELKITAGAHAYTAPLNPVINIMRGEDGLYALTRTPAHVVLLEKLTPGGVC